MNSLSLPSASQWGHQTPKISPDELIAAVSAAVEDALGRYDALADGPEFCTDADGYARVSVEIALSRVLVDQLMNGATGYRAHYSISVEAGERFNHELVDAIAPLIVEAEGFYSSRFEYRFCAASLLGPFSKFWYPKQISDPSAQGYLLTLNEVLVHPRWVNYWRTYPKPHKGLLAPISEDSSILLNGTFVNNDGEPYEQKLCRSQQLFESGWT